MIRFHRKVLTNPGFERARLQPRRKWHIFQCGFSRRGNLQAQSQLRPPIHPPFSGLLAILLALATTPAHAHVGTKDVFEQIAAGPYTLFVTIRTPTVIPGVATVEVRASGAPVTSLTVTPIPLTGEASQHPPTPDLMQPSAADPAYFTGSLWLMASGSWQVHFDIEGAAGHASAGVPVPAIPLAILTMRRPLGIALAALIFILAIGMAGIVAAAVRDSRLAPGLTPTPSRRRRALIASAATLLLMALAIYGGEKWWNVEAADFTAGIYRPSDLQATLSGDTLDLTILSQPTNTNRRNAQSAAGLLLDHGHPMHLYAIRMPQMDAAFHLHPNPQSNRRLALNLPAMPPGDYKLFADIVHTNGFPETLTTDLTIPPGLTPTSLAPEDASAAPPPLSSGDLGPAYKLPDGFTMVWDRPASLTANTATIFHFHLLDPAGHAAQDMQPYLGMAGHAAFVKADGSAFAHTHPEGSAAMPALMLANASWTSGMESATPTPNVDFPYGFPTPGRYRIFIQMKHASTVETGVFDAEVH